MIERRTKLKIRQNNRGPPILIKWPAESFTANHWPLPASNNTPAPTIMGAVAETVKGKTYYRLSVPDNSELVLR